MLITLVKYIIKNIPVSIKTNDIQLSEEAIKIKFKRIN